jgi:hypothetical protein
MRVVQPNKLSKTNLPSEKIPFYRRKDCFRIFGKEYLLDLWDEDFDDRCVQFPSNVYRFVFFFILTYFCILPQRTLVGLVRDLRGIAFAFNAKTSFMMLFEWMYPYSNWERTT